MDDALKEFMNSVSDILKKDPRYKEEAYLFVMASLGRVMESLEQPRHITGQELLKGVQEEAEKQFGPMAQAVLTHWGIKNSLDFGHIVFNMVREGILSKTEQDTLDDFRDAVFFQNLFDQDLGYRLPNDKVISGEVSQASSQWKGEMGS